ncbi:MAG TPA: glycosyltransferase 87 family protein [Terracidiphilus sp.]
MAPTVRMPFEVVRPIFFWMLVVLSASSTLIWLRALRWEYTPVTQFTAVVLTLGSLAAMQGLKLEQISLLVSGLVAIAVILLMKDHPLPAGILLAFATIKPQLVVLLLLWLAMWTLADWRRRYLWCASFLVTMIILLAASEWCLPHWIPRFWQALREYQDYTGAQRVLEKLVGTVWGRTLEALAIAMMLDVCWTRRRQAADTAGFVFAVSIALGITVLVAPTYAVYNQVLLIPALLMLVEQRGAMWRKNMATRLLLTATAILVVWPWIASVALAAVSFILPRETVQRGWAVPFWSALLIPVGVASAMLVSGGQKSFAASAKAGTS